MFILQRRHFNFWKNATHYGKTFIYDEWNAWSDKSKKVNFKSSIKSIGDGEEKIGAEFNIIPLGQNYTHDFNMPWNDKWECKKMDSDNSFRLGVEVSTCYTCVIRDVINVFEYIISIKDMLFNNTQSKIDVDKCITLITNNSGKCKTSLIDGLKKNEVSESNLIKADEVIKILSKYTVNNNKTIQLFSSFDGNVYNYTLLDAFNKLKLESIDDTTISSKLGNNELYNISLILNSNHNNVFKNPVMLSEKLNNIVRSVFDTKTLVLVDELKGYMPIKSTKKIICNRITSGAPRCKYI